MAETPDIEATILQTHGMAAAEAWSVPPHGTELAAGTAAAPGGAVRS